MSNKKDKGMTKVPETDMQSVKMTFKDEEHMDRVVNYLNNEIGRGRNNWRINVPLRKYFKMGRKDIKRTIRINSEKAEKLDELRTFLGLL